MKKFLASILSVVTILTLSVNVFATEYKVVNKNFIVQKEIPQFFTYDKTCYRIKEKDNNYIGQRLSKYDKDWVDITIDEYIKEYEERNSLGITY